MRVAFLVPDPHYPAEWRWAYDAEADALIAAGMTVEPVPWTDPRDHSHFDLVMPLVAWGYHQRYAEWLALLDRLEREQIPVANPVPLLRWNSDKAYLQSSARRALRRSRQLRWITSTSRLSLMPGRTSTATSWS